MRVTVAVELDDGTVFEEETRVPVEVRGGGNAATVAQAAVRIRSTADLVLQQMRLAAPRGLAAVRDAAP